MSAIDDLDYYRQRELATRRQQAAARDPAIAAIHGEMADRYAAIVRHGEMGRPRLFQS